FKLILQILSSQTLHKRTNEFVADSLGVKFMQNAGFSINGATEVLEILKESDYLKYRNDLDVISSLSTDGYPIESSWINKSDAEAQWEAMDSLYYIPDSLRTHPACDLRIQQVGLMDQLNGIPDPKIVVEYNKLKYQFEFETLQALIEQSQCGLAIYYATHMKEVYPNNLFLDAAICDAYFQISRSFKRNEFSL